MRKGPEHVPASWLLLAVSVALLIVASFCGRMLIRELAETDFYISALVHGAGLGFYGAVLLVTGHGGRIVQTLTCVVGCWALLSFFFVAEFVFFRPVLGTTVAATIATLIVLWSVPVEGHIIARALRQHWFVGVAIAIAAFVLQAGFQDALTADG